LVNINGKKQCNLDGTKRFVQCDLLDLL
jgi:hypothetical protein